MVCSGCQQRREIGRRLVNNLRVRDYSGAQESMREMGESLGKDVGRFLPTSPFLRPSAPPPSVSTEHARTLRILPGHERGGPVEKK